MGLTEEARPRRARGRKNRSLEAHSDAVLTEGRAERSPEVRSARRLAMLSLVGLCVGVALTATGELTLGPLLDAASLAAAILAAHKLGRAGPDPGQDFAR